MTKIIGLTGGIGSGKTTIAKYIESQGIPVYIADDIAKKILELPQIKSEIASHYGEEIFENGKLNRHKLAEIVFSDSNKLKRLNDIVHPAVRSDFDAWLEQHSHFPWVVKEAAILFESGSDKDCDVIITVTAPLEDRIQRIINRDNTAVENVMDRIKNQWTDEMRTDKSDYIVENKNVKVAKHQIDEILKKLNNQQKLT
ncbi:dephospho-CoA kinase [Flavobacterium sp. GT3R68]|uniref:dephospho-CoA kinase n=1 Tax=Flavobacterium sp. GT3R68 TaxID=2594437 RepID=UPI000F867ED5|nr:dephospho-CoA kinase [Flavobacterium sp. GT3R68]RTY95082.1 dephospho-CoA kinase [Flavobacterium sp. GSN2]TRW91888.1 dephospho-CoA kinase [Flavobacterium sp. GT3R68]